MLKVEQLICGYGGPPVVKDVSFQVREGERLCILGPNGCGKTTLLRALSGLLPCEGTVKIMGTDIHRLSPRQRAKKLALMSQLSPVSFAYTVYETVMLGRYAHRKGGLLGGESMADRQAVEESLKLTGTWEMRDRLVTELSGGQLQRVFLARIFAQEPQVIVLDEPTNHLDLRYQAELIDSLRTWTTVEGRCVVGVFHDINLALAFADTLLLLNQGRVLDPSGSNNLIYHINPTLRTRMTVTGEEVARLIAAVERLQAETSNHGFVLPQGCEAACTAHLLRVKGKCLVRLLYRHMRQGHETPPLLMDVCNLLSGYFFLLALKLNALAGTAEMAYVSRNYS